MKFKELIYLWKSDFARYMRLEDDKSLKSKLRVILMIPGYKFTFFMRLCNFFKELDCKIIGIPLFMIFRLIYKHYEYKFGIQIPYNTRIGGGLYIAHYNCIVVNGGVVLGNNVTISQGVTIGYSHSGVPRIGDNVYLGAGAKVIGGVKVGNNVAVGANCVVTKDVPDNGVVVGIPGKVISFKGNVRSDSI